VLFVDITPGCTLYRFRRCSVTSILFGGFFIGVDQIPVWLSWLQYLSYIKYGFAAIMQNEFVDRPLIYEDCTGFCPDNGNAILWVAPLCRCLESSAPAWD